LKRGKTHAADQQEDAVSGHKREKREKTGDLVLRLRAGGREKGRLDSEKKEVLYGVRENRKDSSGPGGG